MSLKALWETNGWRPRLDGEVNVWSHNLELAKSLVGHPYASQLTKDEKTIIVDMTKSMVKPRNILLTLTLCLDGAIKVSKVF